MDNAKCNDTAVSPQAKYRRWLHNQGRCVDCKKRDAYTMNGRHRCFECNEKFRQWQSERRRAGRQEKENTHARQRYEERRAAGVCVQCGKSTRGNGKARCAHCLEINRRSAERQHRKKNPDVNLPRGDNGICYLCNKIPAVDGERLCIACHNLLAESALKLPRDRSEHIWQQWNKVDFRRRNQEAGTAG